MGEFNSMIAMRPITFFIFLTFVVLLLPSIVIPIWYQTTKKIEHKVQMEASYANLQLITRVGDVAKLMPPINSSALNLARVLGPVANGDNELSFSEIVTKVAPTLFKAQMIIPSITQVSYIGLDGLFFAYTKVDDQIHAIYSNVSFANDIDHYTWYTQLVKPNNGELYGEVNVTKPRIVVNETWFQQAMDNPNNVSTSLGLRWSVDGEKETVNLFLGTAKLGARGAISLGFLVEGLTNFFSNTELMGASIYLSSLFDGKVLMQGLKEANIIIDGGKALVEDRNQSYIGEIPCHTNDSSVANVHGTTLDIEGADFIFYCATIDIAMVPMVYVLAFPNTKTIGFVHKHSKIALILLCVMIVATIISIFTFVVIIVRATRREVHLCAAYMREMEKTGQAERKSMKQSLAFASANHDVRGYLAGIKGLIELCLIDLPPSSELASNLKKMDTCAEDLLALVNSILDLSKIEAGKMQLEEKEFNLAQLLEDVADLYHPVAMKNNVEVILDPCEGSIFKFSQVKGDRGKLKQILSNLLSNAVKFTSQGHICIRCHAKKPSLENSIIVSHRDDNLLNRLSRFLNKNKSTYDDLEEMKTIQQDPNCMEFVFEVEDTGPGIPKDKRRSIFEDFVQVKENSTTQVGTGLGLGIVQSLVRLMGGDIAIVDKTAGEQGACFKFNIFLIAQEEHEANQIDINSPSLGLTTCVRSPKGEKSLVILLMQNEVRREMVHRYMESLGINVKVVIHGENLFSTLKKIKSKLMDPQNNNSSLERSDDDSTSSAIAMYLLSSGSEKVYKEEEHYDEVLPMYKRPKNRVSNKCILLVVDCNADEDFHMLQRSVIEFRKDFYMTCTKVVWLDRPDTRRAHFKGLQDESLPWTDIIISEPLHGSRLSKIIRLLPEFGGDFVRSLTTNDDRRLVRSNISTTNLPRNPRSEIEEEIVESNDEEIKNLKRKKILNFSSCSDSAHEHESPQVIKSSSSKVNDVDAQRSGVEPKKSPLEGKKILLVEDQKLQRMLAEKCITRLGAEAQTCENGKEAFELVCKALSDTSSNTELQFPYDCILMDCQMPVMDGFEATRRIREEEKRHAGVHIPIIALTAHEVNGEEGRKIAEAGMDFHLTKPLQPKELLKIISDVLK